MYGVRLLQVTTHFAIPLLRNEAGVGRMPSSHRLVGRRSGGRRSGDLGGQRGAERSPCQPAVLNTASAGLSSRRIHCRA